MAVGRRKRRPGRSLPRTVPGRRRMDAIYVIAPTVALTAYAMLMAVVLVG